jgi:hypothetical protein
LSFVFGGANEHDATQLDTLFAATAGKRKTPDF